MTHNHKKILCKNIIFNNECKYQTKCLYAHTLEEQNVNNLRKYAYDIIKGNNNLSHINLQENIDLYKTLVQLSVICHNCINNNCTGGYNCKYGACKVEYVVCLSDINFNKCTNNTCSKIHLSKRGLKPLDIVLNNGEYLDNNLYTNIINYRDDYTSSSDSFSDISNKTDENLETKSIFQ